MKRVITLMYVLMICLLTVGCSSKQSVHDTKTFPFTPPDGFCFSDESSDNCSIIDSNNTKVGGIIVTELKPSDLTDEGNALPLYIYAIDETSEYMSWIGEDPEHPICYMSQYVTDEETSTQRMYYRVFFEENDVVYDMWFDTSVIDKTTISSFFYIAEQSSFDVQDTDRELRPFLHEVYLPAFPYADCKSAP